MSHSGYTIVPRKYTKSQRANFNKKLAKAKAISGKPWLPLAEYRRLKKEKEVSKNFVPPLTTTEPFKPPEAPAPPKPEKGLVDPSVCQGLNFDAKIVLFMRNFCRHYNNPKTCKTCINRWKEMYKIP